MKKIKQQLLVSSTGKLLQEHAFDHLSDEKLGRMNSCLSKLNKTALCTELVAVENELLELYGEANLYNETASPAAMHQWFTVMSNFGKNIIPQQGWSLMAEQY